MFKENSLLPEIQDMLSMAPSRLESAIKLMLVVLVHILIMNLFISTGKIEPYSQYQEIKSNQNNIVESYDFSKLGKTFIPWQYSRLDELSKDKLESLIISSVPKKLKPRVQKIITHTIELCEYYQLDPLWVLSVMWTESHFNPNAKSIVNANGLMQIMPKTAHFLLKLMNRPVPHKQAQLLTKDKFKNIDMGTFYLRRLFILFKFDFKYATIAYNMGPNGVMRRLRAGRSVGHNHHYLKKVKRHYQRLLKPILNYLEKSPAPYRTTFVVQNKWRVLQDNEYTPSEVLYSKLIAHSGISSQRLEL